MDLDNPSYFSVPKECSPNNDITNSSSECSLNRNSPPRPGKLSLRTFLRSFSSNSADSNQELLILGEPRLSDIAPDLINKIPSRSGSLRSRTEDIIYQEESGDEVFLTDEVAKYYNSPVKTGQRRHSIGTFIGRERSGSASSSTRSYKDELPQGIVHATSNGEAVGSVISFEDHSARHASYPKKKCPVCVRATTKKPHNMDDIAIVSLKSSEAAALWVTYFSTYFDTISKQVNRKPFRIQTVSLEDCLNPIAQFERNKLVKLQLVVLCPSFLEFLTEHPIQSTNLGRMFLPDRTLALLLGVSDKDITPQHEEIFPTYIHWQRLTVGQDQDENFAKEFLGKAMSILSKVWKQQTSQIKEKATFSVSPKKIRQGKNTVFILLTSPLQKEDIIKVSIERRKDEVFEVKTVKRRNPYTIKISLPGNLTDITSIVNIVVEKNGNYVGRRPIKCESRLKELEQILHSVNNPVEFMYQTLGFNREQLDNWLLQGFLKSMPAHFNLLANHDTPFAAAMHAHKHSLEEYPTLLHFAAKFGLEKLTLQLLECPGAELAYDIRNVCELTPADIAEASGYPDLASNLRGYMNMNEFSNVYAKLKEISSQLTDHPDHSSSSKSKTNDDSYKFCPPPRPVHLDPLPIIVTPASECTTPTSQVYMSMRTPQALLDEEREKDEFLQQITDKVSQKYASKNKSSKKSKNQISEDKVQKELLEIINDFKNNVHSITQVEQLVDEWKNRNDVQKSFEEKQEQLNLMRMQYEKIQQDMKASLKKTSPFERFLNLFGRGKAREEIKEVSSPILTSPSIVGVNSTRPISSLSTSSSGSSGRMSTISGSSLGDSGTHSDNEERKTLQANNEDDYRISALHRAVLELHYSPVPAPKPVKSGILTNKKQFETIEEKPVLARPDSLPLNNEYYIKFPSNRPVVIDVQPENETANAIVDYVNVIPESVNGDKSSQEHEYMNIKLTR